MKVSALETALNNEMRERDFYMKCAERTRNEMGKKMFRELALEEERHYDALKIIYDHREERGLPLDINAVVGKKNVRNVLRDLLRKIDTAEGTDEDDRGAIQIAIEFEEKGVLFYQKMAKEAETKQEKAFFELLSSMEMEHLLSLKDSLEYFQDPEGYFMHSERGSLDGA